MDLNNPSEIFAKYAAAYDVLNTDKDYESECDFLGKVFQSYGRGEIRHILDLGCGTGGHAIPLARRGYKLFGIDRSPQMLADARKKAKAERLSEQLRFKTGNIQNLDLCESFDAVICMFNVLGYQTSNEALFATLRTVSKHLRPDGLFICDFWYGPAVLKQRPTDRVKIIQKGGDRIIRLCKPKIDIQTHIVNVFYHLLHLRENNLVEETEEKHSIRFIFKPEIEFLMSQVGLSLVHFCSFSRLDQNTGEGTWNVSVIARLITKEK